MSVRIKPSKCAWYKIAKVLRGKQSKKVYIVDYACSCCLQIAIESSVTIVHPVIISGVGGLILYCIICIYKSGNFQYQDKLMCTKLLPKQNT